MWSAKRIILIQLVLRSAVALSTAFVNSEVTLIVNRFALGLAEGGALTCTIVLIRSWFTRAERARANTLFLLSLAIGPVIANPISGIVLSYVGWRAMFVIEALPALVWGSFGGGRWPTGRTTRIGCRRRNAPDWLPSPNPSALKSLRRAGIGWRPCSTRVLLLALYNFAALMAEYGVNFWLPTVIKESGQSIFITGFLSAIPYAVGAVMMLLIAWLSDRSQERKWHMIAATGASGLLLMLASLAPEHSTAAILVCLTLSVGAFLGRFGPFWTLPSELLPPAVAGVGIGLINGAGNLGGTVGPYFFGYLRQMTGNFSIALLLGGISLVIGSLIAIPIRRGSA